MQQQSGETVFGPEAVVVQQEAGGGPAGLFVHRLRGAVPSDCREAEIAGDLLGESPAHEVACLPAVADVIAGHPAFEVSLVAGDNSQTLALKPAEEVDCGPQMLAGDRELGVRDVLAAAASAKSSQEVPGRVPVQDFPSLGGRVGGDKVIHVSFEADHLLIPLRQGAGGHEHAALDDFAFQEFVQGLVRQGPTAGAEFEQAGGDDASGEPAHRGAGPFGCRPGRRGGG
ncbi:MULTISPECIES: hypothetical protein [unclassified Streptomyces]|uniref:hypothetical protein n=1 Tax=unclassified Streptomyces TaxID=2593676 RepID=UPI003792C1A6